MWQYFVLVEVNCRRKTKCNICNLDNSQASDTSSKQQTSEQVMGGRSGIKMTETRYQLLFRKIAEMCALDFRPLSIINGRSITCLCFGSQL